MRIIKKWVGRQPEGAGEIKLLEVTQAEMFEQMYPLLGQCALPPDPFFDRGVNPLADCETVSAQSISELVDTSALLPAMEASEYLLK